MDVSSAKLFYQTLIRCVDIRTEAPKLTAVDRILLGKSLATAKIFGTTSRPSVTQRAVIDLCGPTRFRYLLLSLHTVVASAITSGDTTDYRMFDVGVHANVINMVPKFQDVNQWFSVSEVFTLAHGQLPKVFPMFDVMESQYFVARHS